MDTDSTMQLFYLVLLGVFLVGWVFAEYREGLARSLRMALVWGMIFLGAVAAVGLWEDIRDDVTGGGRAELLADDQIEITRGLDGHFHLTLEANGVDVPFMLDTGASDIVLSAKDARRVGIDPATLPYLGRSQTANGTVRTARARLQSLSFGAITDSNVRVSVVQSELGQSLLGMSWLRRFGRIEIIGNKMILER